MDLLTLRESFSRKLVLRLSSLTLLFESVLEFNLLRTERSCLFKLNFFSLFTFFHSNWKDKLGFGCDFILIINEWEDDLVEEESKKKICSVSTTTSTGFGFLLWNQTRQQWVGDKAPDTSKNLDNPL
ncbi:uncharacterized protein [Rutidosis leptorrhynchoides]|uniref:uncharacterized protein isoform X1 n=1 Tax=Rutidosis leptorrhynchoides TaxID=125765 RepID=UPI003A98D263